MSDGVFNSMNPYNNVLVIRASEPEAALTKLRRIDRPVKILYMGSHRSKFVIVVGGDIRNTDHDLVKNKISKGDNKDG